MVASLLFKSSQSFLDSGNRPDIYEDGEWLSLYRGIIL